MEDNNNIKQCEIDTKAFDEIDRTITRIECQVNELKVSLDELLGILKANA